MDWVGSAIMIGGVLFLFWAYRNKQFPFDIVPMMMAAADMPMAPVAPGQQPVMMMPGGMTVTTPTPAAQPPVKTPPPAGGTTTSPTRNIIPPPPVPKPLSKPPRNVPIKLPIQKPPFHIPTPITTTKHNIPITVAKHMGGTTTTMTTPPPAMMMMPAPMMTSTLECGSGSGQCCGSAHKGNCHSECCWKGCMDSASCKQCLSVCGSYEGMCNCSTNMPA
jgi:hypothetical protein